MLAELLPALIGLVDRIEERDRVGGVDEDGNAELPRGPPDRSEADVVGRLDATEVLIDDRPVPYARELWLPLIWFLIPR